eukprot:jgi/Mesvir1/26622/Mv22258-RA.1
MAARNYTVESGMRDCMDVLQKRLDSVGQLRSNVEAMKRETGAQVGAKDPDSADVKRGALYRDFMDVVVRYPCLPHDPKWLERYGADERLDNMEFSFCEKCQVIRYLTPTAGEEDPQFQGKIRVTDDGRISIIDVLSCFGQRDTPVTDRQGMAKIIMLLPGKIAARFRDKMAVLLERYLDADRSLAEDILRRADARDGLTVASAREHPRVQSSEAAKELNAAIKAFADSHKGCGMPFPFVHDSNNLAVTGKTAAQLRSEFGAARSSRDLNTRRQSAAMTLLQLTEAEEIKERGVDPVRAAKRNRELCEPVFRAMGLHEHRADKQCRIENERVMRVNQRMNREARIADVPAGPQAGGEIVVA